MASPGASATTSLQIRRTFQAPREKVFEAWTDAQKFSRWFCHMKPGFSGRVTEMDLRPGGRYRVEVRNANGQDNVLRGEYREIIPPEKLVFTWGWETMPQHGETLVTIEFFDRDGQTEVVLTHENFPTVEARNAHNDGWISCFDSLGKYLSN